jgi:hypothetical protein
LPPKAEAERYYLLTLSLAEAIQGERWDEVTSLFGERHRMLTELESNDHRFTEAEVAKIKAVETKAMETLKSLSDSVSSAIRSAYKSNTANRAYTNIGKSGQLGFSQVG